MAMVPLFGPMADYMLECGLVMSDKAMANTTQEIVLQNMKAFGKMGNTMVKED